MGWEIGFFCFDKFNRFYWWIEFCWKTWVCWKHFGESFQHWILTFRVNVYFFGRDLRGAWIGVRTCILHAVDCYVAVFFDAMLCFIAGAVWKCWVDTFWNPNDRCDFCFWVEMWVMNKIELWVMNNSRFEIKDSESSGGNISSFRNVASDLLDGLSWPQAFQQRLQHRKVPILDRCEVLVVGAGPAGSIRLAAYWGLWDNFSKKNKQMAFELENHGLILVYFGEIGTIFHCY